MEHAGFHSGEELIVEPFAEATTVTEHSLGERKRRAGVRHAWFLASEAPFIGESSHPPDMFHLRHKDYSVDDPRQPISRWNGAAIACFCEAAVDVKSYFIFDL